MRGSSFVLRFLLSGFFVRLSTVCLYVCTYYYDNEVNHFFLEDLLHSLLVCVCVCETHILIEFVSFHWICWTRTFWFLTWWRLCWPLRLYFILLRLASATFLCYWLTEATFLHFFITRFPCVLGWASVSSHMPIDFAGFFFDWIWLLGLGPFWLLTWWGGGFFLLLFWWLGLSDVLHLWSFTCQSVLWKTDPRSTPLMIYFSSSSCAALVLFYAFCSPVFCLG